MSTRTIGTRFLSTLCHPFLTVPWLGWVIYKCLPHCHDMGEISPECATLAVQLSNGKVVRVPCAVAVREDGGNVLSVTVATTFADVADAVYRSVNERTEDTEQWRKYL